MTLLLDVKNLSKTYPAGSEKVRALQGVSFHLEEGQFASLMGPSGCGKSTLLHLLGGMEAPTAGEILFEGRPLSFGGDVPLSLLRRNSIGFVFQFFNLLPHFTALENVEVPLLLKGEPPASGRARALELLSKVGLDGKKDRRPSQLSGGEQQRVAIARALVNGPRLLLADEPTGNLDTGTGKAVLDLLRQVCLSERCAVLMATHSREASEWGDLIIMMRDGQINAIYPVRR